MLKYRSVSSLASKVEITYDYSSKEEAEKAKKEINDVYEPYLLENPHLRYSSTIVGVQLNIVIENGNS